MLSSVKRDAVCFSLFQSIRDPVLASTNYSLLLPFFVFNKIKDSSLYSRNSSQAKITRKIPGRAEGLSWWVSWRPTIGSCATDMRGGYSHVWSLQTENKIKKINFIFWFNIRLRCNNNSDSNFAFVEKTAAKLLDFTCSAASFRPFSSLYTCCSSPDGHTAAISVLF